MNKKKVRSTTAGAVELMASIGTTIGTKHTYNGASQEQEAN
jgi:hypothetical protein